MITKELSQRVITISCDYKCRKGGVATVVHTYASIFEDFRYIMTTTGNSSLVKLMTFVKAVMIFIYHNITNSYDIVHIHGSSWMSFKMRTIFIAIAHIFNKKIIFHNHGGEFKLFTKTNYKLVKKYLDKVDVVVALSSEWKDFFEQELLIKNVIIIRNIIPIPKTTEPKSSSNIFTMLYLGAICPGKGIFDLLEVLANNRDKYNNRLLLKIGGNGETEKLVRFINDNKLDNIVSFEGWVDGDKKIKLLSETDIYILPSYNEGLPISILEAMSYKKPIISTRVGGIPQIVDDSNGFLIEPGDKLQIKNALDKAISMTTAELEMLGISSFLKAKPYMADNVEKELISLYTHLLEN